MSRHKTTEEFVLEAQRKYGLTHFDYSETVYVRNNSPVKICCRIHNLTFEQTPSNHLIFNGCTECVAVAQRKRFQKTTEQFILDSKARHGNDKYNYSLTIYVNNNTHVTIICKKHGPFQVTPINHLKAQGVDCQKCGFEKLPGGYFNKYFERKPADKQKPSILYFVLFTDITSEYSFYKLGITTQTLATRFASPAYQGFEIVPVWTASGPLFLTWALERHLKRIFEGIRRRVNYLAFNGSTECFTESIPVCVIPGNLSVTKENVNLIASRILIKSGIQENRWFARSLTIENISVKDANVFLSEHHFQGSSDQAKCAFGLKYQDELVSVMSFGKPRFRKDYEWELIRFATKQFSVVAGGASRLFKAFVDQYNPSTVVSYSDRSWNTGNVYIVLGFKKTHITSPNYWYVKGDLRYSRVKCQKHKLAHVLGTAFDPHKSESQNMYDNGFHKVFDEGQDVFVWQHK